jgi:hypothetical protein
LHTSTLCLFTSYALCFSTSLLLLHMPTHVVLLLLHQTSSFLLLATNFWICTLLHNDGNSQCQILPLVLWSNQFILMLWQTSFLFREENLLHQNLAPTKVWSAKHQGVSFVQLRKATHCHLSNSSSLFRLALLQHKGGYS